MENWYPWQFAPWQTHNFLVRIRVTVVPPHWGQQTPEGQRNLHTNASQASVFAKT